MNPSPLRLPGMGSLLRTLDHIYVQSLPERTTDNTPTRSFSRPFSLTEIEEVKAKLATGAAGKATGPDDVDYDFVVNIPNDDLRALFHDGYRNIGLESCLLKTLTLLIERRLREWDADRHFVPSLQNGFQERLRTENNVFALRAAVEQCRSNGETLWVASVDLANAFPSVDQSTLWAKLHDWGAGGPLFD
ncbi:hypothetical protein FKP32DRAFT_1531452, partial [Trametes sanguinea]